MDSFVVPRWMLGDQSSLGSNGRYIPYPGTVHALAQNAYGTWTETNPKGHTAHYDSSGKLSRLQDESGNRWTLTRDGSGNVQTIIPPAGGRTTYAYDYDVSQGIKRITDAAGRITTFSVDESGDLVKIISPDLRTFTFVYDANHQMTARVDATGARTSYAYDANGYLNKITQPQGGVYSFTYIDGDIRQKGHKAKGVRFHFLPFPSTTSSFTFHVLSGNDNGAKVYPTPFSLPARRRPTPRWPTTPTSTSSTMTRSA